MRRAQFVLLYTVLGAIPPLAHPRGAHAAPSSTTALSLTLLYDLSVGVSSVPLAKDEGFKRIVKWVANELQPSDQLRLGFLTERPRLTRPFKKPERATLWPDLIAKTSVPDAERFGASPLWDSLDVVVRTVAQDPGRRAILVLTDGRSTGNRIGVNTLVADANAFGVSIWPIVYGPSEWYLPDRDGRTTDPAQLLSQLAKATGGRSAPEPEPPELSSMESAFQAISRKLQNNIIAILGALHQ
jgi:hypothetical protein